jgi:hypothetical protein
MASSDTTRVFVVLFIIFVTPAKIGNVQIGHGSFARCVTFTISVLLPAVYVLRVACDFAPSSLTEHETRNTHGRQDRLICNATAQVK